MGNKGWAAASPRSTADRHFMSDSVQSLPPVRVCTPPARGEGAMLRGNYTSSSSEVSLERTPREHSAALGASQHAAAQQLMHWHSAPAEDPGHLRPAASDAQQAQVHLKTPQHSPHSACRSTCSESAAACPLCPDSEAKLAAARDAVVDLMQRLTDATEERDEALAAAQREWRLAELLRQELAATPDHPQAQAASRCGRPSSGLRSSRIPDVDSSDRFNADWQAAKRNLAAAGDAFLSPHSSAASPAQQHRRRYAMEAAAAADAVSEAYFTPAQQLLPLQHDTSLLQDEQTSGGKRRSFVQRQLLMDDCRHTDAARPWLSQTPPSGSPPAATYTSSALGNPAQQMHSAELAAAEARADALEQKLSRAGSFIAQLLLPQGSAPAPAGRAAVSPCRGYSSADRLAAAAGNADGLLQRLQALATEAADVSRPANHGAAPSRSSSSRSSRWLDPQQQQHGTPQHGRCSRLSTTSRELPPWALEPDAAATDVSPAVLAAEVPSACVSTSACSQQCPGSPLAAMQEAVQQMGAIARSLRATTSKPLGLDATAAAAGGSCQPTGSGPGSAGCDGCAATGLDTPAAARVALKHARMNMASAARALAQRSAESLRLLSPSKPPLLGC